MAASMSRRWRALLLATAFAGASTAIATAASASPPVFDPPPIPPGPIQPVPARCSSITSFSPASARPGEQIDISIAPGPNTGLASHITGVTFANNVPARAITVLAYSQVRATVPLAASAGHLRVTCRSVLGGTFTAESTTDFAPIPFGLTVTPASATRQVGQSVAATATLSHPAPEPVTLSFAPSSNALSVGGQPPGQPLSATIPTGQRSVGFTVTAHAAGAPTVTVSGHNVAPATLTVNVPTPWFAISGTVADAAAHWGGSATYAVNLTSGNGFAGPITLTADNNSLPFGATAAPVTVNLGANGSTTATFTVATVRGATDLGADPFTLRATSPGVTGTSRTLDLEVFPVAEAFDALDWLETSSNCDAVSTTYNDATDTVVFNGLPGTGSSGRSFQASSYAFTRDGSTCRGAVLIYPSGGAGFLNFGFDSQIANLSTQLRYLGTEAWNLPQFRVSRDASLLIPVSGSDASARATLWRMLDRFQIGSSMPLSGTLNAAVEGVIDMQTGTLQGARVTATPAGSNAFNWSL